MKKSTPGPYKPTASTVEYRRPLFAVARFAKIAEGGTESERGCAIWGKVRVVRGGVGQHHRDLLDVIRAVARHRVIDGGGQEHLIFDVAAVRELIGNTIDWRDIKEKIHDMLGTVLKIDGEAGRWGAAFPIATFAGDANSLADRASYQYSAHMKRLVLSAGFTGLLKDHPSLSLSKPVLETILSLQHTVSRAVARWCISHSVGQHQKVARVLAAVGAVAEGEPVAGRGARSAARRYVTQLRDDVEGLEKLGVALVGEILHYRRKSGVFVSVPTNPAVVPTKPAAVSTKPAVP